MLMEDWKARPAENNEKMVSAMSDTQPEAVSSFVS